jgi:DNA mismatch endonuclease (patch repair protein)
MVDKISAEARSKLMGRIHDKDTKPELVVRSILHRLGFRFRLHRKDLPGRPDIVLPKHRKVILVHGCFWHGHTCRRGAKPKSNQVFWETKILSNQERDRRTWAALTEAGWSVLELWECEMRAEGDLTKRIMEFMRT